jgi:signal transduction histidine kinase
MPGQIEFFLLGLAAVIDTVLLLALLEPVNRLQVPVWLKAQVGGLWIWHACSFLHGSTYDSVGWVAEFMDNVFMIGMASGLLILPSAMLHSALRLQSTGLTPHPPRRLLYVGLYVPVLCLIPAAWLIFHSSSRDFLVNVAPLKISYLVWLIAANIVSSNLFLRQRNRLRVPGAKLFFIQLAAVLIVQTTLAATYALLAHDSDFAALERMATNLLPLVPALLFAWYVLRRRMLPLVMERTLVYGAALAVGLLLHRMTISRYSEKLSDRLNLDTVLLEAIVVLGLIMAFRPMRRRLRESLRHLFGRNILSVRESTRRLSLKIAQESHQHPMPLLEWFANIVPRELELDWIRIVLYSGVETHRNASRGPIGDCVDVASKAAPQNVNANESSRAVLSKIHASMAAKDVMRTSRGEQTSQDIQNHLDDFQAMHVFALRFHAVDGLLLLGPRTRNDSFSEEQLDSLSLLFDQFAATVHNRVQELARVRAERKAMQEEKLSVLGLLAGSLAHELRNPLSSMRTIASLLVEDLGADDERTADVRMIISEIDRLTQTTQRLLDVSRPADDEVSTVSPDAVVLRLIGLLKQLARQWHVTLDVELNVGVTRIAATDASFSEICFNLIRNAIEAVRETSSPNVRVASVIKDGRFVFTVADNGPGIDPVLQSEMFQPFVTRKSDGTGLGLYVVAERVAELNGQIHCVSASGRGTAFEVSLPISE